MRCVGCQQRSHMEPRRRNPLRRYPTAVCISVLHFGLTQSKTRALNSPGAGSATRCLSGIAVAFCSVALALLLFGFIRGTALSQYTIGGIGGYDYYSMNLVSPIDPGHQGALLLAPQQIGPGQYEGYNYLGLGMLMLAVISVARNPASLARFFRRSSAS